jgi:hypothetical protein
MLPTEVTNITIIRWDREVIGNLVPMSSNEAIDVLAPRLGPTSVLLLHRFARRGGTAEFTTYDKLAGELGVAPRQLVRTVERIIRFGFARWADAACETLEVATEVGFLPPSGGGTPVAAPRHLKAA